MKDWETPCDTSQKYETSVTVTSQKYASVTVTSQKHPVRERVTPPKTQILSCNVN